MTIKFENLLALLRNSIFPNMLIISFYHREHRAHRGKETHIFFSVVKIIGIENDYAALNSLIYYLIVPYFCGTKVTVNT